MEYAEFRRKYLPRWSKDNEESRCMNDNVTFSFFCRRHHCRICGRIFCWKCSTKTINVARFVKTVRVCDHCHSQYNHGSLRCSDDVDASNGVLWIPDEWVPYCMCCADMFNWSRSRDHCRKCGQVVCRQCSKTKTPLPTLGFLHPVPVCKKCATGNPTELPVVEGERGRRGRRGQENFPLAATVHEVGETVYSREVDSRNMLL